MTLKKKHIALLIVGLLLGYFVYPKLHETKLSANPESTTAPVTLIMPIAPETTTQPANTIKIISGGKTKTLETEGSAK